MERRSKVDAISVVTALVIAAMLAMLVLVTMWLTTHVGLLHAPAPQVRQIVGTPLTGAYVIPPTPVHDVYAVDVVRWGGVQTTLIEVEVPWSTHSSAMAGWYRVPITLILPGALP